MMHLLVLVRTMLKLHEVQVVEVFWQVEQLESQVPQVPAISVSPLLQAVQVVEFPEQVRQLGLHCKQLDPER